MEDDGAGRIDLYKNEEPERRLSAYRSLKLRATQSKGVAEAQRQKRRGCGFVRNEQYTHATNKNAFQFLF